MKYISKILLACPLLFSGCDKDNGPVHRGIFTQSYIHYYEGGQYILEPLGNEWNIRSDYKDHYLIPCPELAKYELEKVQYRKIAERNGDLTFNNWSDDTPGAFLCSAENFQSLSLVSDTDWDASHPAGMPLDEIVILRFQSYDPFIKNGYENFLEYYIDVDGEKKWYGTDAPNVEKCAADLTESDLRMVKNNQFRFWFDTPPADHTAEHTLTVTLTTTEGKVYTATGTGIPPVKMPE